MRFDFSPLFRSTVGFDRLFDTLDQVSRHEAGQSYPPYNIERIDDDRYRVTVAVAGFSEEDLSVEVRDDILTVTGKHEDEKTGGTLYVHRGIAGRAFEHRFQLADHVEVREAKLQDGLLHITLRQVVPEGKKPRRIQINAPEPQSLEAKVNAA